MIATGWTDERIAELKRLWELGLSCSQIAAELGHVSRNAVIGKLHRLGLCKEKTISVKSSQPRQRASRPRLSKPRLPPPFPPLTVIAADEPEVAPDVCPNRVSLLEATEGQCRWPAADDGSAMMVCGDPKYEDPISRQQHAWCARHCRVAFMPMPQRRRTNKPVPFRRIAEAV